MIVNGFDSFGAFDGTETQVWLPLCTFNLSGSWGDTLDGDSPNNDKTKYFVLGSSSSFALPNAMAFKIELDSTTKFTAGYLSGNTFQSYSGTGSIQVAVLDYAINQGYKETTDGRWYDDPSSPVRCKADKYYVSTPDEESFTSIESAAKIKYEGNNYVYHLTGIPGTSVGDSGEMSSLTRMFNFGSVYGGYTVGSTAYVVAVIWPYMSSHIRTPSCTCSGTLYYMPAI